MNLSALEWGGLVALLSLLVTLVGTVLLITSRTSDIRERVTRLETKFEMWEGLPKPPGER